MTDTEASSPLACVMGAIAAEDRSTHRALIERLFGEAAGERRAHADGYAFRFAPHELAAVARFITHERKCCPFLTFELVVANDDGPIWLRLRGPAGTRAFLDAELPVRAL